MLEVKTPDKLEMPISRKRGLPLNMSESESNITLRLTKREVLPPISPDKNV